MSNPINAIRDLPAHINIRDFRVVIGASSLSPDRLGITIPFTGIANPGLTAELLSYEYSMDNGSHWSYMDTASVTWDLDFTPAGASFSLLWNADSDIGTLMFNTHIRIRLQAQSGSYETAFSTGILYFERTIVNSQLVTSPSFPADYKGIPGRDLLANAPRSQSTK